MTEDSRILRLENQISALVQEMKLTLTLMENIVDSIPTANAEDYRHRLMLTTKIGQRRAAIGTIRPFNANTR